MIYVTCADIDTGKNIKSFKCDRSFKDRSSLEKFRSELLIKSRSHYSGINKINIFSTYNINNIQVYFRFLEK